MAKDLIRSVIRVVARSGVENTTVKKIAAEAEITGSGIYAYYTDKDDLLRATFLWTDEFFAAHIRQILRQSGEDDSLEDVWKRCFRFFVEHREETLFYLRFTYSTLYTPELMQQHCLRFRVIRTSLPEQGCGASRQFLFEHVLNDTLAYAERFLTGKIEQSESVIGQIWDAICDDAQSCLLPETERRSCG